MKKHEIHLPKTDFPMRGNLPQREPEQVQFWEKNRIYSKIQEKSKDKPLFTFLDGPPYANGNIHLGTALNKILKDILVKQSLLSGKRCPFIPIWDCHGLPIELEALKKIKSQNPKTSPEEIRQACRKTALHWSGIQKEQFKRIGVLADWENTILTMDPAYRAEEIRLLARMVEKNLLYRGRRPIHWCFKLQTAAASSEVEYQNHKSPSIDAAFPITNDKKLSLPKNTSLVIWTTTPWTLPANEAVCLHPNFNYGLYQGRSAPAKAPRTSGLKDSSANPHEVLSPHFILACELLDSFQKRTGLKLQLKKTFKGKDLEGLSYQHPIQEGKEGPTVLAPYVTLDSGTGLVHTAPGHGIEDFVTGQKYKLPLSCPVDERGCFSEKAPEWLRGRHVFKANPLITEYLKKKKNLIFEEEIEHSYPYNPRSKSPLIFRTTNQWFLRFDDKKYPIRKKSRDFAHNKIHFVPEWNRNRLLGMIKESPDWCLSRQRVWGLPLIVFYCGTCDEPLIDSTLMTKTADQIEKEGLQFFFKKKVSELIPKNQACKKCGGLSFKKGEDILDVWFDSGVCHSVFKKIQGDEFFPADVYLEGSDQHRGWFQTSLHSSIALHEKSPFKTLITHGFVYDLEKRKMSKSLGNIIDPEEMVKKYGAEILRLWTASSDYSQDISSGDEIFGRIREAYRRFRNTIRFLIGNLYDFKPSQDLLPLEKMRELDQWILSLLSKLSDEIQRDYKNFEFHKVYQNLNQFFTISLSSLYLDILKDRLYTFKKEGPERRSAQSAIYLILENLITLMAPITSFLSEEAYPYLPEKKEESVFLTSFKKLNMRNPNLEKKFETLLELRAKVSKEIENLREKNVIGSSLQAQVDIKLPSALYKAVKEYPFLEEFFIVSKVSLREGEEKIEIKKALGEKCPRCWHFHPELSPQGLCPKCEKNI